jgi:hypothetical protein
LWSVLGTGGASDGSVGDKTARRSAAADDMRRLTLAAAADEVDRCHPKWGLGTARKSDEEDHDKGAYEDKDGGPSFAMIYTYVSGVEDQAWESNDIVGKDHLTYCR